MGVPWCAPLPGQMLEGRPPGHKGCKRVRRPEPHLACELCGFRVFDLDRAGHCGVCLRANEVIAVLRSGAMRTASGDQLWALMRALDDALEIAAPGHGERRGRD